MRTKAKLSMAFVLALAFMMPFTYSTLAADSTAASIELSSNTYLADTLVTIRVYDVAAAGSEFTIWFSYDSSGTDTLESTSKFQNITVYLGSDEDEFVLTQNFPAPTAGAYVRVHVRAASNASSADLASATIYVQEFPDLVNLDLFITIGVYLMIILIMVGITVGLARKSRG